MLPREYLFCSSGWECAFYRHTFYTFLLKNPPNNGQLDLDTVLLQGATKPRKSSRQTAKGIAWRLITVHVEGKELPPPVGAQLRL